jgi:hypothetical protein
MNIKQKLFRRSAIVLVLITGSVSLVFAWGVWGHQHINHAAVFALPKEMRAFYYNHIDFITEESVVPDIRKYTINDKPEFARHYIDIEAFENVPFDSLPRTMKDAMAKYDDKILQKNGILPWYLQEMMVKLTKALKDKRKTDILFLSADLGHYIADANMPLHTSLNHDGQLTDQKGIHGFWEAQLPEMFGDNYNFKVSDASYISDITKESWSIVKHSHGLADSLLQIERNLKASFPKDKIYKTDSTGGIYKNPFGNPVHTFEYAQAFHVAMKDMVQNQMRHAIQDIANFWYTAWVNAGKPDLNELDPTALTKSNAKRFKKEAKYLKQGKLFGFKTTNEY